MKINIAIAQTNPVFGDIGANLNQHIRMIEEAKRKNADLIVFPELSLSGYYLQDMVRDVAVSDPEKELKKLIKSSDNIGVIAGFIELSEDYRLFNSAVICDNGMMKGVNRKIFLPTYGMFEEARYFAGGDTLHLYDFKFGKTALLICEDAWHPELGLKLIEKNVTLLIVTSCSPVKGAAEKSGNSSRIVNTGINRFYSQFLGIPVVFANRTGYEQGVSFYGGSMVFSAGGDLIFQAPEHKDGLFFVETDLDAVRRSRISFPYLRDIKNRKEIRISE